MKMLLSLFVLAIGVPAFACQPMQLYAPQQAPVYMQQSYMQAAPVYAPQYAMPSVFLQQPPSFTIINNNNNNGGSGTAVRARGLAPSMGVFVPTAGTQVNFIGRRAFRLGRGITINP